MSLRRAAALGAVSGLRTFTPPAALALRGRLGGSRTRRALVLLCGRPAVGDKLATTPPRNDAPSLAARVVSGALVGRTLAASRGCVGAGARAGAATAAATTFLAERGRARLGERTGIADPLIGLAEDLLAVGGALAASRPAPADSDPPARSPATRAEGSAGAGPGGRLAAAAEGVAASAVGTAAMSRCKPPTRA